MPPEGRMFEWSAELLLHDAALDNDHRRIFGLAEELHQAMLAEQGRRRLGGLLEQLVEHTRQHLGREEELMRRARYPDLDHHRAEHETLVRRVTEFERRFREGETTMTIELMHFLSGWLETHIRGSDRRLVDYLRAKAA